MSGLNLGLKTAAEVRKIAEDGMAETQRAVRMLCDELQMHEASYEMLVEERKMLLAQLKAMTAERDEARREVARLLDVETGHRIAIANLTAERDEARRSCCEFAAMVDSADTVLMYVDSNRFHEIAMRYMKSSGWDCYKEDGK